MNKLLFFKAFFFLIIFSPTMIYAQTAQEEATNHMIKLKFGSFVEQGHLKSIKKALKTYPQIYRLKQMGTKKSLLGLGLAKCTTSWRCGSDVITFFVNKGVDINNNYGTFFPLEGAITSHNKFYGKNGKKMRELQKTTEAKLAKIEKMGPNIGPLIGKKKNRVLSEKQSFDKVKLIISLGANVNQIGAIKMPLPYLAKGDNKLLALLFNAGADIKLSLDHIDKEIAKKEKIVVLLEKYK